MTNGELRCELYEHHKFSSVQKGISEDIVRFATFSPEYRPEIRLKTKVSIFFQNTVFCLFCYRIGHYLYVRRWRRLADAMHKLNLIVSKANIPPQSCIGPGCFLGHCAGTTFYGTAGRNLTLFSLAVCCPTAESQGGTLAQGPYLGDSVTVGGHSIVIGAVTIGDNIKIAPMTRLDVDCPSDKVACSARLRHTQRPSGQDGGPPNHNRSAP